MKRLRTITLYYLVSNNTKGIKQYLIIDIINVISLNVRNIREGSVDVR